MVWETIDRRTLNLIKGQLRRVFRYSKEKKDFLRSVTEYDKIGNRKRAFVRCVACEVRLEKASKDYQIDHITPIGSCSPQMVALLFDTKNLQILCTNCHDKKTLGDRKLISDRNNYT
jgi:hypothetical protein